ncbi:DUF1294 domain-containing protein [uncultured Ruminococcus sp.]|uniref:DUF1294 domain-containing protein n=1 Tax=uncultured Ruminococcus sp. TaxID=165186 RepID=UPI0025D89941|nr:DUF1294 domain-containing protein [uncultured Ruminococcus sp.]
MGKVILICYAVINLIVFIMFGADKTKAKYDKWRTPENRLIIGSVFGIIGGLLGMVVFHHKTRKPKFSVGLPVIFIAEAIAAAVVYTELIL